MENLRLLDIPVLRGQFEMLGAARDIKFKDRLLNDLTEAERVSAFEVIGAAFSTPSIENAARNPAELEALKFGRDSN